MDWEVCEEVRGIVASSDLPESCTVFKKDPTDVLDYFVDWSESLAANETISTCYFTAESGLSVGNQWIEGEKTYCVLYGGTLGSTYVVRAKVTTNQNHTYEAQFKVEIGYQ